MCLQIVKLFHLQTFINLDFVFSECESRSLHRKLPNYQVTKGLQKAKASNRKFLDPSSKYLYVPSHAIQRVLIKTIKKKKTKHIIMFKMCPCLSQAHILQTCVRKQRLVSSHVKSFSAIGGKVTSLLGCFQQD